MVPDLAPERAASIRIRLQLEPDNQLDLRQLNRDPSAILVLDAS